MPHDLNFHYQDCENLSPHWYHCCKHSCRPLPVISFRASIVAVLTYSKEWNKHYYSSKEAINCITKILWARQAWKHTDIRFQQVVNKEDGGEKVFFCSNQLLQHSCVLQTARRDFSHYFHKIKCNHLSLLHNIIHNDLSFPHNFTCTHLSLLPLLDPELCIMWASLAEK